METFFEIYFKRSQQPGIFDYVDGKLYFCFLISKWCSKKWYFFLFLENCIMISAHSKGFSDFSMICTEKLQLLWTAEDLCNEIMPIFLEPMVL